MSDLVVPHPPRDVPYVELDDRYALAVLEANGYAHTAEGLGAALASEVEVLQGAAAHAAGELGERSLVAKLKELAAEPDDTVRAEAAYALARLGEEEGRVALRACLEQPPQAYLCPSLAAGFLARLGDAAGFPVLERALAVDNELVRTVACKQLYFFAGLEGVDVFPLFEQALADSDEGVRDLAAAQLRELDLPEARRLLG